MRDILMLKHTHLTLMKYLEIIFLVARRVASLVL